MTELSEENHLYQSVRHNQGDVLADLNRLVEIDPRTYLSERIDYFLKHQHFERATDDVNKLIVLDLQQGLLWRANFNAAIGNREAALADYSSIIDMIHEALKTAKDAKVEELKHHLAVSYVHRAFYNEECGNLELANTDFRVAAELDASYLVGYRIFCITHRFFEDYLSSINHLVELNPDNYLVERSNFYEAQGNLKAALCDCDSAVKKLPIIGFKEGYSPRGQALMYRARLHRQQKRWGEFARDILAAGICYCLQIPFGNAYWKDSQQRHQW